jgi:hypothetical protein
MARHGHVRSEEHRERTFPAYASVDPPAQQVDMAHGAGVLLDQSDQREAQRHRPSTASVLIQGIVGGGVETGHAAIIGDAHIGRPGI